MESADITHRFAYHAPDPDRAAAHAEIRTACADLAHFINDFCPDGREKSLAVTKLEEVMLWANAALARATDGSTTP